MHDGWRRYSRLPANTQYEGERIIRIFQLFARPFGVAKSRRSSAFKLVNHHKASFITFACMADGWYMFKGGTR